MQKILVDSNVILDIVELDPAWNAWSANALASCAENYALVINPVIYAEVSVGFASIEEMSEVLPMTDFEYAQLPWEAAFLAGKCFLQYRNNGGLKRSTLPDFFIGAHAAVNKMGLLTRDSRRYRTYFPTVRLICPESS
jgi:predicted nucleic acid-binding protein